MVLPTSNCTSKRSTLNGKSNSKSKKQQKRRRKQTLNHGKSQPWRASSTLQGAAQDQQLLRSLQCTVCIETEVIREVEVTEAQVPSQDDTRHSEMLWSDFYEDRSDEEENFPSLFTPPPSASQPEEIAVFVRVALLLFFW